MLAWNIKQKTKERRTSSVGEIILMLNLQSNFYFAIKMVITYQNIRFKVQFLSKFETTLKIDANDAFVLRPSSRNNRSTLMSSCISKSM